MEMKEAERVIVAKPVASRPSCSNFRSFSELLSGAINVSPANVSSENTVAAIRPKSVRFKSMMNPNRAPPASVSNSQADNPSDKVSKSDSKPTIYKPQARLVSKATVSLLANMGNFNVSHQQQTPTSVEAGVEVSNRERCSFTTQATSNFQSQLQPDETAQNHQVEGSAASGGDRPSYDGYNWRKYGQKQVKGSEYPRSYYKCTHPNCPVKKKVERSLDGQIAEIVYKGEHNHSKPQPAPKRNSSSGTGGGGQDAGAPLWSSNQVVNERNEGRVENENENAAVGTGSMNNAGGVISDNSCGVSGECEEASKAVMEGDHEDQEPKTKRRKSENQSNEAAAGLSGEAAAAQGSQADTDQNAVGDGFRWRKYGQKVVKGNSYPRSYYRCTGPKCNVRKYVERVSDDPAGAFITTYEGKHNHDMPLRPTISQPASNPRTPTTTKP